MRVAPSSPACLPALLSEDLGQVTRAGPDSNSGHLALQRWEPLRTEKWGTLPASAKTHLRLTGVSYFSNIFHEHLSIGQAWYLHGERKSDKTPAP